jgi:4'-phosphopantetheinyl transferase
VATGGAAVDIWAAPLDVPEPAAARLSAVLAPDERERAARYCFARDQRRFGLARAWLRHVIASYTGVRAEELRFSPGRHGKPELAGGGSWPRFNLSHAEELVVVAVGPREVGVDVEHLGAAHDWDGLLASVCTVAEASAILDQPHGRRPEAFLRCWTRKEAYLKARGVGLSQEPTSVQVDRSALSTGGPGPVGSPPGDWWARELRPADGYIGSVVAETAGWRLRPRRLSELPAPAELGVLA